jgi:hypothetical protein
MDHRELLGLFVVGALLAVAAPAGALEGSHCAARLEPSGPGGEAATVVELGCFATYAEALVAGSAGSVHVPEGTAPSSLTDAVLAASTEPLATSVLIGTEFDETLYLSSSKSYFASATCSASVTWEVSYVGDTWNDRFESGKGFGGCDHNRKFAASGFGGSSLVCTPNCTSYGTLNNEVSSLRWKD